MSAERYWEARWRDEKAENERLTTALAAISNMCPATAEYTVAHEMAQVANEALGSHPSAMGTK